MGSLGTGGLSQIGFRGNPNAPPHPFDCLSTPFPFHSPSLPHGLFCKMSMPSLAIPVLAVLGSALLAAALLLLVSRWYQRRMQRTLQLQLEESIASNATAKVNSARTLPEEAVRIMFPPVSKTGDGECLICLHPLSELVLALPCGHAQFCYECGLHYVFNSLNEASQRQGRDETRGFGCPVCRERVEVKFVEVSASCDDDELQKQGDGGERIRVSEDTELASVEEGQRELEVV